MEAVPKSNVMRKVYEAIDKRENLIQEVLLKGTNLVIQVSISFSERDSFVDANGVKWIRG